MRTHAASFDKHRGYIFLSSLRVVFYGVTFKNMCSAIVLLKTMRAGDHLTSFTYRRFRGIVNPQGMVALVVNEDSPAVWASDRKHAKEICMTELKRRKYIYLNHVRHLSNQETNSLC